MSAPDRRVSDVPSSPGATRSGRAAAGVWGWVFVVLLLLSAGMASVPGGDDPTGTVRDFYARHSGVVVAAQVVGLLENAGLGVAAAAVLTAVPVLWLTAVIGSGADGLVHGLAVASDLSDVLLFATIAVWAAALLNAAEPVWFKTLGGAVGVLALARALLLLVGSQLLERLAPLAFVVLVAVLSTLVLGHRSPLGRR